MCRLLYCPLGRKLVSKTKCQKLRQDKDGNLYDVKVFMINYLNYSGQKEKNKRKASDSRIVKY